MEDHPNRTWLKRFPCNLETSILHTGAEGEEGWGIEIQEGPNMFVFTLSRNAALVLSMVVGELVSWLVG